MKNIAVTPSQREKRKLKLVATAAMLCFVAANGSANLIDLKPAEDAFIKFTQADVALGIDNPNNLKVGASDATVGGAKSYIKWDASAYAPGDILGIDSAKIFKRNAGTSREADLFLLTKDDGLDDNWDEDTITWNNAPWNNVAGANNSFAPEGDDGEFAPIRVGKFSIGGSGDSYQTVTWGELWATGGTLTPEAAKALVLAELNGGDRKATIGLVFRGSGLREYDLRSKEYDPVGDGTGVGACAPILTLNVIPEPSAFALAGLGIAGLLIFHRRVRG